MVRRIETEEEEEELYENYMVPASINVQILK